MISRTLTTTLLFILGTALTTVALADSTPPTLNLTLPQAPLSAPALSPNSNNLPNLGNPTQQIISPAEDYAMGQEFMKQVRAAMPLLDDPVITDYINGVGMRLVAAANVEGKRFTYFVVNSPDINAFAGPGGYIAVNSGLILTTQTESELAAVMAHETAHVVNNDIAQKTAEAKRNSISMLAAMLAGVAAGVATRNGELTQGTVAASMGSTLNSGLGFSRQVEENADRIGMQILAHAGFDPYAMAAFFERLANQEKFSLQPPAFASDHPLTPDRIAYTTDLANQYPKRAYTSSPEYYLNRERTRVDMNQNTFNLLDYYRRALARHPTSPSLHYGYALALTRARQFADARQQLQTLIQQNPNQFLYSMALARVDITADNLKQAVVTLRHLSDLYPDYYPLILEYAYAMIRANNAGQAAQLLRIQIVSHPDDVVLYGLLARAYANKGDDADAYYARAKILMIRGNNKKAIEQLEIALKAPNISPSTRQQILAQLRGLQLDEKAKK